MNVYKLQPDFEHFALLVACQDSPNPGNVFHQDTPPGEPCRDWKLPRYKPRTVGDQGYPKRLPDGDFVGIDLTVIGLRKAAKAAIGDAFERYGELLPVQVGDDKQAVWVFHCLTVIDAMDVANSNTYGIDEYGGPNIINRYSFYPERVKDAMLFRLPRRGSPVFCTDAFRQLVADRGMKGRGLWFATQWSDEPEIVAAIRKYDESTRMPRKGPKPA